MKTFLAVICTAAFAAAALAEDLDGILAPVAPGSAEPSSKTPAAANAAAPVATDPRILAEKDVLAALEKEVVARLGLEGELRLVFAQPWGAIQLPTTGDWKLSIVQLPSGGLSASNLLRFRIEANGQELGEWQAVVRAQLWKPVWVATHRLDRGQLLDSTLCTMQSIDALHEKQALVPADTDLSLYEMAQTLSQDRPLAWRDLALRPLVRKGQMVEVVVSEGALNISMKGLALASGGVGEAVVVRNLDSKSNFTARVIRSNTVQVNF